MGNRPLRARRRQRRGTITDVAASQVLLIGGGSGTGKTLLAMALGARFGAAVTQVDDIRLALQRAMPRDAAPQLHAFLGRPISSIPFDEALAAHRAVAEYLARPLEVVIAHHLDAGPRLVLEGDGILPALARRRSFDGIDGAGRVAAVFLTEPDEASLATTYEARGRAGYGSESLAEKAALLALQHGHGQWLAREAQQLGLAVVEARPWATLEARVLRALGRERTA